MTRTAVTAISLLWWCSLALPEAVAQRLEIPAELRPTGQYVQMTPDTDAVSVVYVGLSGIEPIPSHLLADKRAFLLDAYGKPAGRYRMAAVAVFKDGLAIRKDFDIILGAIPPGPVPPSPPGPAPAPPSTLTARLQSALDKDDDQDKANLLKQFASLMSAAAELAGQAKSISHLTSAIVVARRQKMGEALPNLRKEVGNYLSERLPWPPEEPLTDERRRQASAAYKELAEALGGVRP